MTTYNDIAQTLRNVRDSYETEASEVLAKHTANQILVHTAQIDRSLTLASLADIFYQQVRHRGVEIKDISVRIGLSPKEVHSRLGYLDVSDHLLATYMRLMRKKTGYSYSLDGKIVERHRRPHKKPEETEDPSQSDSDMQTIYRQTERKLLQCIKNFSRYASRIYSPNKALKERELRNKIDGATRLYKGLTSRRIKIKNGR